MTETRTVSVVLAATSDPGRDPEKQVNEDAFGFTPVGGSLVAVVCDGMGGHEGGSLASRTAVDTILRTVRTSGGRGSTREQLVFAIEQASAAVHRCGGAAPVESRPGATCVALWLHVDTVDVAHVGDSRCYRFRGGRLEALTRDHSVIEAWVAAGQMTREEAHHHPDAHRITRALGVAPSVEVELRPTDSLLVGDLLLLCSDGLTDMLTEADIAAITARPVSLQQRADALVALANQLGGHDNVTALLLEVTRAPPEASANVFALTSAMALSEGTEFAPAVGIDRTVVIGSVDRTIAMPEHPGMPTTQPGWTPAGRTQPLTAIDGPAMAHARFGRASLASLPSGNRSRLWIVIGVVLLLIGLAFLIGTFGQ